MFIQKRGNGEKSLCLIKQDISLPCSAMVKYEIQEIVRHGSCPTRKLSDKTQPNDTRICRRTSVSDNFRVGQIPPFVQH